MDIWRVYGALPFFIIELELFTSPTTKGSYSFRWFTRQGVPPTTLFILNLWSKISFFFFWWLVSLFLMFSFFLAIFDGATIFFLEVFLTSIKLGPVQIWSFTFSYIWTPPPPPFFPFVILHFSPIIVIHVLLWHLHHANLNYDHSSMCFYIHIDLKYAHTHTHTLEHVHKTCQCQKCLNYKGKSDIWVC